MRIDDRLAPGVSLRVEVNSRLSFDTDERGSLSIAPPSKPLYDALCALPHGLSQSTRGALGQHPTFDANRFEYYLARLRKRRMLETGLRGHKEDLLVVVPHRADFALDATLPTPDASIKLSRFAHMRRTERGAVLESPEASCTVALVAECTGAWVWKLATGAETFRTDARDSDDRDAVVEMLWRCGFLEIDGVPENPSRASWEFHDLLFHRASRPGNVLWPIGGSFRFQNQFPSPPAVKARMEGERIELETPASTELSERSGRLFDVMENRRSFRTMGDPPISFPQITEFLFRVARMVQVVDSPLQETVIRVFPSGGAIHEIEFYLSVRQCDGLAPGFYHYHAFDHALERIETAAPHAAAIVAQAGEDWDQPEAPPQIVVTLASRVPRIAWKYDTLAYRATLMNTGVALQTMYLVAADMNLGCAPAGRGDPARFAAATGLDPLEETSIIEFGLGTRHAGTPATMAMFADRFATRRKADRE